MDTFDPIAVLEGISDKFDSSILGGIDESDFKKAPNFLEWVVDPRYLNTSILPKQLEMGVKLFADYCPRCSKEGYVNTLYDQSIGNIRDNVMFLDHGVCPKCQVNRGELVAKKELQQYTELVGCCGQRSGKTKLVGLVSSYITHCFLKIPSPLRHFNQPSGEILVGTFSALTLEQAQQTLWESYHGFVSASPWFQNYHAFLSQEEKKLGIELLHPLKNSLFYPHKRMLWHCTGSQDRKMRGKTRIFAAIDELGWFILDENKKDLQNMNADGVYTALSNSLSTMRIKAAALRKSGDFNVPPIIMANVSSPSSAKDKIMKLFKEAQVNSRILAFNLPSWEMNPDLSFENLREEFSHMDDIKFYRDFGAQPPLTSEPFFGDQKALERISVLEPFNKVLVTSYRGDDALGETFKSAVAKIVQQDKSIPRLLAFDLGSTKNSLAACMFSFSPDMKIKLDMAVVVIPEKKVRANVAHFFENFTSVLVGGLNIKFAFFDRWQSLDQIERLRDKKVDAKVHSLTYKEIDSVRGALVASGVLLPKLEKPVAEIIKEYVDSETFTPKSAISSLIMQILTVRDLGNRVVKPLDGDDDIFRAFCLGVVKMSEPAVKKVFQVGPSALKTGHTVQALGVVRSWREGGVGGSSGGVGGSGLGAVRTKRGG